MKSELIYLLDKLRAEPREGFQGISIFQDGSALATYRFGCLNFPNLAALENYTYPVAADVSPLKPGEAIVNNVAADVSPLTLPQSQI